jgi:hypothetical protein
LRALVPTFLSDSDTNRYAEGFGPTLNPQPSPLV